MSTLSIENAESHREMDFSLEFVRPRERLYVYPPLANLYFRLSLKLFSVWKVTMGAGCRLTHFQ